MQTVEFYRRKIDNARDLHAIVHTMKVLASVSIRQFERAAEALGGYFETVEMGLQIILNQAYPEAISFTKSTDDGRAGIIILGASQGLCGTFDQQILTYTEQEIAENVVSEPIFLVLGERLASQLKERYALKKSFSLPGSVSGINSVAMQLLAAIEELRSNDNLERVFVVHHKALRQGRFHPRIQLLLPLNQHWLERVVKKEWPTNNIPQFTMRPQQLFTQMVRQYLLVSMYRAMAESLAAEHASRLNAMSVAEQKIKERLSKLNNEYTRERQNAITEELLDILSGYRAVSDLSEII